MGGAGRGGGGCIHDLGERAMTFDNSILTIITFLPFAGALLLLLFARGDNSVRWSALAISLLEFAVSLVLPAHLSAGEAGFRLVIDEQWIASPDIHYHLGMDGISL